MDTIYLQLELTLISAISSYQKWFRVKAQVSKQDQAFIFYNVHYKHPSL